MPKPHLVAFEKVAFIMETKDYIQFQLAKSPLIPLYPKGDINSLLPFVKGDKREICNAPY